MYVTNIIALFHLRSIYRDNIASFSFDVLTCLLNGPLTLLLFKGRSPSQLCRTKENCFSLILLVTYKVAILTSTD